ncbi:hypothetical protein BCL90_4535 [Pedobacter alluvionis]|uniref:Uncharacterized protein n=1 Tax=Pedobacter alluvionis TaxID=475253 RepID=A0A497XW41_9SPHI|nr:hypothetical protein BCL90_4535 [Pedobacter alluvionis]
MLNLAISYIKNQKTGLECGSFEVEGWKVEGVRLFLSIVLIKIEGLRFTFLNFKILLFYYPYIKSAPIYLGRFVFISVVSNVTI